MSREEKYKMDTKPLIPDHLLNKDPVNQPPRVLTLAWRSLLVTLPVLCWMIWMGLAFDRLSSRPALDNAQAARHLAAGEGWITSIVRPLSFSAVPRATDHPDLFNPPLFKLVTAALFNIGGPTEPMAALASGLGWMVCAWLIYALTRYLTGKRRAGLLAMFLWLIHVTAGNFALLGENITWIAALITALAAVVVRTVERREQTAANPPDHQHAKASLPWKQAILAGLLSGILILFEPGMLWVVWIPLLVLWIRWPFRANLPDRYRPTDRTVKTRTLIPGRLISYVPGPVLAFLIPALLITLPWFTWVTATAGNHFPLGVRIYNAMINSAAYPGDSVWRYVLQPADTPWTFWIFELDRVLRASIKVIPALPDIWLRLAGVVPIILFAISFFAPADAGTRALRALLAGLLLSALFIYSMLSINTGYFLPFLPLVLILGVVGLDRHCATWFPKRRGYIPPAKTKGWQAWRTTLNAILWTNRQRLTITAIILLALLPLINMRLSRTPQPDPQTPPGLRYIQENGDPTDLILTDAPWLTAWRGNRTAVWFPQRESDLNDMLDRQIDFRWVYIAFAPMQSRDETGDWWNNIVREPNWQGFEFVQQRFPREIVLVKPREN
jgi:hypothetical protein